MRWLFYGEVILMTILALSSALFAVTGTIGLFTGAEQWATELIGAGVGAFLACILWRDVRNQQKSRVGVR